MKRKWYILFFVFVCILFLAQIKNSVPERALPESIPEPVQEPRVKASLIRFISAYPDQLTLSYPDAIRWNDGTTMSYGVNRNYRSLPYRRFYSSLERQIATPYTKGEYEIPIPKNHDPGRYRYYPFFEKMYGSTREEVEKHLVPFKWLPGSPTRTIMVTTVNGVDKKLAAVAAELDKLEPGLKKYVKHTMGMFTYRNILNSKQRSPHSYGIAIDIDVKYSHYWQWDYSHLEKRARFLADVEYRNNIPLQIVKIFEKQGFIWGGKWYHYDTMHFEYRPELLVD